MASVSLAVDLVEFLAVAIQAVLFTNDVYPANFFERRRKWGILVYISRHPAVLNYLRSVLEDAIPWIQQGYLERVTVALNLPPDPAIYRQYHFDITSRHAAMTLSNEQRAAANTVFAAHVSKLLTESVPPTPAKRRAHPGPVSDHPTDPSDRYPEFKLLFRTSGVLTTNQWIPAECLPGVEKGTENAVLVPLTDPDPTFNMFTLRLTLQKDDSEQ